ncbi:hypothetical protein ACSBR2_024107 [Camellia fascicularis]
MDSNQTDPKHTQIVGNESKENNIGLKNQNKPTTKTNPTAASASASANPTMEKNGEEEAPEKSGGGGEEEVKEAGKANPTSAKQAMERTTRKRR